MGELQERMAQLQEQLARAQEHMAADSRAGPAISVEVQGATPQDAKVRRTICIAYILQIHNVASFPNHTQRFITCSTYCIYPKGFDYRMSHVLATSDQ